jgi:hypothetical protein
MASDLSSYLPPSKLVNEPRRAVFVKKIQEGPPRSKIWSYEVIRGYLPRDPLVFDTLNKTVEFIETLIANSSSQITQVIGIYNDNEWDISASFLDANTEASKNDILNLGTNKPRYVSKKKMEEFRSRKKEFEFERNFGIKRKDLQDLAKVEFDPEPEDNERSVL